MQAEDDRKRPNDKSLRIWGEIRQPVSRLSTRYTSLTYWSKASQLQTINRYECLKIYRAFHDSCTTKTCSWGTKILIMIKREQSVSNHDSTSDLSWGKIDISLTLTINSLDITAVPTDTQMETKSAKYYATSLDVNINVNFTQRCVETMHLVRENWRALDWFFYIGIITTYL
jgi:hypothetical protein